MKKIAATLFKSKCLSILNHLTSEGIIITKHGKSVAKLTPLGTADSVLIGALKGKLKISPNILSTRLKWNSKSHEKS